MRNMFEQNRIIINKNKEDLKTHTITEQLVKELSHFGIIYDEAKKCVRFEGLGEHDDMVTSLALCLWGAKGSGNISWNVGRGSIVPNQTIFRIAKAN